MKKILRLVAFSAVAGLMVFASCKKEDKGSSYASGWSDAKVEEAKADCEEEGGDAEACSCLADKVSKNIPYDELEGDEEISDENFVKLLTYAEECDYDIFTAKMK